MDTQPVAARADIHKSCKAIEVVVNLLNDYSEASAAVVGIQKKLAKAAREASSVRNTAEIAGMSHISRSFLDEYPPLLPIANALNSFATVLEAIAEVDVKFAKATDKECESISNDVKKWFKQLAVRPCILNCHVTGAQMIHFMSLLCATSERGAQS